MVNKFDTAMDGQEAIDKVKSHIMEFSTEKAYKLILMDCSMPRKDGY